MNIIYKDITQSKLTIAKGRVELKMSIQNKPANESLVIALANMVVAEIGEVEYTLRGRFTQKEDGRWTIGMSSGSTNGAGNSTVKHFKTFTEK